MIDSLTLEIESIAAGGDGVARQNGLVVFTPRTAPGDVIRARLATGKTFARGVLQEIERRSADRIEPPCKHYTRDKCGGCQLQHMNYDAQLLSKQRIIRDALTRIGKREVGEPQVRRSNKEWRYRTKLTLAMRRTRDGSWIAGLHQYDNPARIFSLEDCPITDERVVSAWRDILSHAEFFPQARELRGSVRSTGDGPVFTLIGAAAFPRAGDLFDSIPDLAAIWLEDELGNRKLLCDRVAPNESRAPSASFSQVNEEVAAELRAHVIDLVSARAPRNVVDAYSGAGETAQTLADKGIHVTAIEVDRDAAQFCAKRLPPESQSLQAKVEDVLAASLPADSVILNPPRAGVDERVTDILERIPAAHVVYVSCNPATLARDLSRLPSYRIQSLVGFDMFPQTAHVETVCELVAA